MAKPRLHHLLDDEGIVHFNGAPQAVNVGLCGFNGDAEETDLAVNCLGCLATLRHVYDHHNERV